MGGMVSGAAQKIGSASPGGGKSSPAPQNAYGSAYQASTSTSAPAQTPTASIGQTAQNLVGPQPSAGGGKSSGMGASGYGMPIAGAENITAPQSQVAAPMPMMGGGKSSGLGQGGYGMAPAFQQPQQQFNPFQQQQFNPFQQQQFNPFQQQQFNPYQQQQFNPFQQQFGGFQQQPQGASGLQALFNNMMRQQQQMQQQRPQQMPRFQSQALQYRPNMQNAQAALSRVKPSVQKQQQDAQAARIAELEAQIAQYGSGDGESSGPQYDPYYYGGG
jgi:hypothetical protein